jgi:uncharacterized protein involved in exopolysaccharide biosynthesis
MVVFLTVFLTLLLPGLAWDFLRPAQYRATASLLTVDPALTGRKSQPRDPRSPPPGPDEQHVAIQGIVLLSHELLQDALQRAGKEVKLGVSSADQLQPMLSVTKVPDTNIVELSAVGKAPLQLSAIVNGWVAAYLDLRRRQVEQEFGEILVTLRKEHENLGETISAKQERLERFRNDNDIVTLERDGNAALARLKALTDGLNKARDDAVEAEARLAAVQDAIARGDPVVPAQEQPGLDALQQKAADLRAKLTELRTRYTPFFLENEPEKRLLPAQLREVEELIKEKIAHGQKVLISQTKQDIAGARRRAQVLEAELAQHKDVAARFTKSFAEYEGLQSELESLQKMYSEAESQVVDMEVRARDKYPPVDVIEKAYPPSSPFSPPYWRDALWVLLGSALAALLAVWVLEYLLRKPRDDEESIPLTGVRVYPGGRALTLEEPLLAALPDGGRAAGIAQTPTPSLPGNLPRELLPAEVSTVWSLAEPAHRQLMALLLCGVGVDECAALSADDFELTDGKLRVSGPPPREVDLPVAIRDLFADQTPLPLWSGAEGTAGAVAELAGRIPLLASDAGLSQPQEVTVEALRHSYLAFLVRQGARLTELERIVGYMPARELTAYGALSPAGPAKEVEAIERVYPAWR